MRREFIREGEPAAKLMHFRCAVEGCGNGRTVADHVRRDSGTEPCYCHVAEHRRLGPMPCVGETLLYAQAPSSPVAMVRAWHEQFGQQVREAPDAAATDREVAYRHNIHAEEIIELHEAMKRRDVVEIADAIADALYVLYGTALSYGIPIDAVLAEVHRSNMTKTLDPSRAKYDGKVVVKGPGYSPPRLAPVLALAGCPDCEGVDRG